MKWNWASPTFCSKALPTLTIQYQNKAYTWGLGHLHNHTHQLIAPFYDVEHTLEQGPGQGIYLQYSTTRTQVALWLNWLALLHKPTQTPEEFLIGLTGTQHLLQYKSLHIAIPIQLVGYHIGGQGIDFQDYSICYGAIGGKIDLLYNPPDQHLTIDSYYIHSHYIKNKARSFKKGQAWYSRIRWTTNHLAIQGSYWQSQGFSSENRGILPCQSIAIINQQEHHAEKFRQLLFLRLQYHFQLAGQVTGSLFFEPYYDRQHNRLEHAEGIYITYQPCFSLTSQKT